MVDSGSELGPAAVPPAGAESRTASVSVDLLIERATTDPEERRDLRRLIAHLDEKGEATVSSLLARLGAAQRAERLVDEERLMLMDTLSAIPCALLVVAPGDRVRVANRRAFRVLARHPALQVHGGRIQCLDPACRRTFQDQLAATLREPGARRVCSVGAHSQVLQVAMAGLFVGRPPSNHAVLALLDEGDDLRGATGFEGILRVVASSAARDLGRRSR